MAGDKVTMEQLATALGNMRVFDRPLVDHTGLSGVFDLTLRYTPQMDAQPVADGNAPEASQFPPIVTALQEQLGLKLEPTVGPLGTLVIDHVEHLSPSRFLHRLSSAQICGRRNLGFLSGFRA